ncbi:MAG: rRNA maturation RNase YbeY [Pseudomonadota bacterium]
MIEDPGWTAFSPETLANRCLEAVKDLHADPALDRSVTALFTDDETVRALNAEWRGKDKPTNVLSFPAEPMPGLPEEAQPLGDLALALEMCTREASEKGISFHDHAAHLLVHGLLHLLGYDHIEDGEAETMESLERTILRHMGIADPYGDLPD